MQPSRRDGGVEDLKDGKEGGDGGNRPHPASWERLTKGVGFFFSRGISDFNMQFNKTFSSRLPPPPPPLLVFHRGIRVAGFSLK